MKDLWQQITPSQYPWEREALDYLKRRLPDHEPYRAWANFEFLLDGNVSEVDALVAVPKGLFLVEIKSWPGRIEGDAGTWRWTRPGSTTAKTLDNPYLLANHKAKRLKSLLARQKAFRGEQVPFVAPLVFLSHAELDCRLIDEARHGVVGLDPDEQGERSQRGGLPGVIAHLTSLSQSEAQALGQRRIDRPTSKRIAQGLEQAGIRPARRNRIVGDLELRELLDEGPGYQDFLAVHRAFPTSSTARGSTPIPTSRPRSSASRPAARPSASTSCCTRVSGDLQNPLRALLGADEQGDGGRPAAETALHREAGQQVSRVGGRGAARSSGSASGAVASSSTQSSSKRKSATLRRIASAGLVDQLREVGAGAIQGASDLERARAAERLHELGTRLRGRLSGCSDAATSSS